MDYIKPGNILDHFNFVNCISKYWIKLNKPLLCRNMYCKLNYDVILLKTKKYKVPRIEPWETRGFTAAHPDNFLFRTTVWYLFERKFSMIFSKFPDIIFFFLVLILNLDARLCQTLLICQGKYLLLPTHHQRTCKSHE